MAAEGKTVARREGVSTFKPGSPQRDAGAESQNGQDGGESRAERKSGESRASAVVERQGREAAAEATRLEQKEGKIEQRLDDAKERGDTRAVAKLQSELDRTRNTLREAEKARDDWPRYLIDAANRGLTPQQIIAEVRAKQQERAHQAQASKVNEVSQIIEELIDSGDDADLAFARWLRNRARNGMAVITHENLASHRAEFDKYELEPRLAAERQAAQQNGDEGKGKTQAAPIRRTPPRTAGVGGGDLGEPKTGWREGASTIDLLRDGFKEQDAARARH